MARSALLAVFLLSAAVPSVYGTTGGCLMEKHRYRQVTAAASRHILSFIKLDEPLHFVVEFEGHELTFWRDWVTLTNSRVTYGKVRDGGSTRATQDLPLVVSEGWNTLRLEAVGSHFELTLLFSEHDEEATLLDLGLDFPVSSVHVEGTFSLCSGGSPEWEVAEGDVVTIPLQAERNQMLQVTGRGDAAPYLRMSSSAPPMNIPVNTTLTIQTRQHRSAIQVEVLQKGTENKAEVLGDKEQPAAFPTLEIGCRTGSLHLRLDLFIPPDPPDPPAPPAPLTAKDCHSADSSGDSKAFWPMGFVMLGGGAALGGLLGAAVVLLVVKRKEARRATASDAAASPSASEKLRVYETCILLPSQHKHAENNSATKQQLVV